MKKTFNRVAVVASSALVSVSAFAQTAGDPFSTAVTDITAKVGTYGAGLVGVAVVGVGFLVGVKYVKKIRGAA